MEELKCIISSMVDKMEDIDYQILENKSFNGNIMLAIREMQAQLSSSPT